MSVIVTAAIAPMMREPSPRAELVSQMVIGETASLFEEHNGWCRVSRDADGYGGWTHHGYLQVGDGAAWTKKADSVSEGALLQGPGGGRRLPMLARVAAYGDEFELPSGWRGRVTRGSVDPTSELVRRACAMTPVEWAIGHFSGSPYLWGGVTPWGVDCSGLVQTVYAARGVGLPRDSGDQATRGVAVSPEAMQAGDLLFFSETGERITHVAFFGNDDTLVHSTLSCGGFVVESFSPGSRAGRLRSQLVAIRRITG